MIDGGFRDQSQVERIRERLWSGRDFGRASVMVGAGFSRNAERGSPDVPIFPLWGEIAGAMYDALYPSGSVGEAAREGDKKARTAGVGAMRLASEYETTFGPQALDDLLTRAIPDDRYEPGPVHETLLSLPWSDVFTTNYDTLLERTRGAVHERKYDLVLAPPDVPAQSRPRIVKLHGSFPSHRPFVTTEEDF
ncbi:MAG: SIR2 family protein, partial [Actinomycetota bacterium]|nr:SIR2 family protein [Actinomycetota bacterium]